MKTANLSSCKLTLILKLTMSDPKRRRTKKNVWLWKFSLRVPAAKKKPCRKPFSSTKPLLNLPLATRWFPPKSHSTSRPPLPQRTTLPRKFQSLRLRSRKCSKMESGPQSSSSPRNLGPKSRRPRLPLVLPSMPGLWSEAKLSQKRSWNLISAPSFKTQPSTSALDWLPSSWIWNCRRTLFTEKDKRLPSWLPACRPSLPQKWSR
mmetsp:Transcript_18701/g.26242  ORF Transcript_18701/g.26242 Transcript_18701/m.26242 type:complete len:205 (-) Transcript_18701:281-895(-)